MLRIDLRHLRTQLLQSVNQTAQAPSPLAVGTVVFQFRIETVEIVVATSCGLASEAGTKLTVVVHLCLLVDHRGDGALLEDALRQGDATGADHQGVGSLSHSWVVDKGTEFERLSADGDRHLQRVAVHTCLHGRGVYGRLRADLIVLDLLGDLPTAQAPVLEVGDASAAVRPHQRIRQGFAFRALFLCGQHGISVDTGVLRLIDEWRLLCLGADARQQHCRQNE